MTKLEKQTVWIMIAWLCIVAGSVYLLGRSVRKAGGIKGIAVSVGKNIKDVAKQIAEDD